VFAVPGNVTAPTSRGTNRLIKVGATLVEGAEDILAALPSYLLSDKRPSASPSGAISQVDITPDERRVLALLDPVEVRHIDWIIEQAHLPTSVVSGLLLTLELDGRVTQLPGKLFIKALR
jgi:DNA processing protein